MKNKNDKQPTEQITVFKMSFNVPKSKVAAFAELLKKIGDLLNQK